VSIPGETSTSKSFIAPNPPQPVPFSNYITDVSPSFADIYNQANAAECYGLDQIAGMGYRKSLEFLIKDYLISKTDDEDKKEAFKSKFLGRLIADDVDNPNLKIVAERAT